MGIADRDQLVDHPTFLEQIRFFFDAIDIDHMGQRGIDLATYDGVKANATSILAQTKNGKMPPEPERRWPANRVKTFKNWITDRFPMGVVPATPMTRTAVGVTGAPVRRDAASLSKAEVDRLAFAFQTIMQRDPTHTQGYFKLADIHWFPAPVNCLHHEERYNPWHRVFIDRFEKGLQSVPGCEDIKLPYWNVAKEPPAWLFRPPFDSYTLQLEAAPAYPKGHKTKRFSAAEIQKRMTNSDVEGTIRDALAAPKFERFTALIEQAHDDGHLSTGPSMQTPDIAAFDPIFWFFHCNWERLWWAWQRHNNAMTLESFRQTLENNDTEWLDTAPLNELPPFQEVASQAIDATGYSYEDPARTFFAASARVEAGNIAAGSPFRISRTPRLSVRVKNIARLSIPGSFVVHLVADGKSVASHGFFQGTEPSKCPSCIKRETVNVDLRVNRADIAGKRLEVQIEAIAKKGKDRWLELAAVGSPTINVRELLAAE